MGDTPGAGTPDRWAPRGKTLAEAEYPTKGEPARGVGTPSKEPPSASWWVRRQAPEHMARTQDKAGQAVGAQWMLVEWT